MRLVVLLLVIGLPIALVLAWAFELTPEGIKRTEDVTLSQRSGRGWLWIVLVGALAAGGMLWFQISTRPQPKSQASTEAKSIAVLPFENLSEDKANAYFADGMQDEIITRLAKVGDLKVISRTSTLPYRTKPEKISEIARQLGVAHVVEGTVQRIADRVRINVQLIEAATDKHLWAELFDRNVTDVFEMQSEVATKIAGSLQAKLSGREQKAMAEKLTDNMAAYDAYLRGIDFHSRPGQAPDDQRRAAESFAEAVRLDPRFSEAWARLSGASSGLYIQQIDLTPARREIARSAAETAARLNPESPETLLASAYYQYQVERDYAGARELFEKIRREVPSSSEAVEALARIARRQGRWRESIRLYEEAAKLNPRDAHLFMDRSWTFSMVRDPGATLEMIERAEAIVPNDIDVLVNKAAFYQWRGELPAARAIIDKLPVSARTADVRVSQLTLERRYPEAVRLLEEKLSGAAPVQPLDGGTSRQWLGWLRSLAGDAEGARKEYLQAKTELEKLAREQPDNVYISNALAQTEAGLGNKEAALREAARGMEVLPASGDAVSGPLAEENLALVEAQVGEHERAIERLERLLRTPYGAYPVTVAKLQVDPNWDPLRQHPRFKAILEGPEPKTIYH
ncbi:MAG: tetratricopeptide repeat protein [Verrucomicrobiota bacterium]|nr:tetratricopeptide repeat protein [Verrucomicrobiota bacterium]